VRRALVTSAWWAGGPPPAVARSPHRPAWGGLWCGVQHLFPQADVTASTGAVFAAGVVLLWSAATPPLEFRLDLLRESVPFSLIETAHVASSVIGIGLVVAAWGLHRRLRAAFDAARGFLLIGAIVSLVKALDYEEAAFMTVIAVSITPLRNRFDRRAALATEPFTPGWTAAVIVVLAATAALSMATYRDAVHATGPLWRLAVTADAPWTLRAGAGAAVTGLAFAAARLLYPVPVATPRPTSTVLERACRIAVSSPSTAAQLVRLGDKALLFSATGRSFLMYAVRDHSWVALRDPVGPPDEHAGLVQQFRELAERQGGRAVFYLVAPAALPIYLDLGLHLYKLGEQGRVRLSSFSLAGRRRKSLRQAHGRFVRAGFSMQMVPPAGVPALLPTLRGVSDDWLAARGAREKHFSLGHFDEGYLTQGPVVTVRRNGTLVAFANALASDTQEELSVDLMRYVPAASRGVMDYLFVELMLWGAAQGFRWFDLGMAPLSGLDARAFAPFWHRMGSLVYAFGDNFYNFRGLRAYKAKFDPLWEPRYLAAPGGIALLRVLADVIGLVSGRSPSEVRPASIHSSARSTIGPARSRPLREWLANGTE
jgi:phosphatidylglycerol lysyltransferase